MANTRVSKVTKEELKEYDDEKRIVIFVNKNTGKTENGKERPGMRGNVTIDGKKYWISLWKKVSSDGEAFMQGVVQPEQTDNQADDCAKMIADL